jgi:hypothetical protein
LTGSAQADRDTWQKMTGSKRSSGHPDRAAIVVVGGINTDYVVAGGERAPIPETLTDDASWKLSAGRAPTRQSRGTPWCRSRSRRAHRSEYTQ